ncbi:MAG: glycosyltransferase family 2 protein [Lachnospiraceae bacterium]|nr:glycosyltransferase family 2 protein [Lachnospiraceae bacterium]
MAENSNVYISIIMPCLDEENTVGPCVDEAYDFLSENQLNGEVIVVDNCSSDDSAKVALDHGAQLIEEGKRGYGHAIRSGLDEAAGQIIVIVDCDMTYDMYDINSIIKLIEDGYDMVIGDRFSGIIEKGAMPYINRIGAMILSKIGRIRFKTDVNDFHCGIRGVRREALEKLDLNCGGMEFATEMIAKASMLGLRIAQTPVKLRKCALDRRSKLRIVRDGLRHLSLMCHKY